MVRYGPGPKADSLRVAFELLAVLYSPQLLGWRDRVRKTPHNRGFRISAFCGELQKSEFERNVIRKRTLAGLKAARARGRVDGRPEKLSVRDKQQISAAAL